MRALVIRPFGEKRGVNFDAVEARLIAPALDRLSVEARLSGEVAEAGAFHEDIFELLLRSDLVVADISLDNPTAYYELGIRQALAHKPTFLIRARGASNDVPFDLATDRYLSYDAARPGDSLEPLSEALHAIASARQDSPAFRPPAELSERDPTQSPAIPQDFRQEVEDAAHAQSIGKLALLAQEAAGSSWETEAFRIVGRELNRVLAASPAAAPTILFTGHQIDAPGRKETRFPADKEPLARAAIRQAVAGETSRYGAAIGVAGAASGGDILFHEVCAELGLKTKLYLALPPDAYVAESVAPAGGNWVRRFHEIQSRVPAAPILARSKERPAWLRHRGDYSIWQRNNLWMLNEALAGGMRNVTLIALWNGKQGDGPGGTADMIHSARARGAEIRVLDTPTIFGRGLPVVPTQA